MLALALTAELGGVTDLKPTDTADNPYFYTFKVQCTSCRETHPNWVTVNRHEMNDLPNSKGEANFVWRCKNCKRDSSASIKAAPAAYAQQSPPKATNIVEFDCRGLEFVEFKADACCHVLVTKLNYWLIFKQGEFEATGLDSGTKFAGIDLSEGEWFDYDEKAGEEVSIKDAKWEIRRA